MPAPRQTGARYTSSTSMRKIIHIDMDAFYASVEQRDRPELKGKPVVVGGLPDSRGVVAACSYEARRYGIHSAMPSSRAHKLCPHAVFLTPRFDAYRAVSMEIREIFLEYTDLMEPLSLDEAFLDVTINKKVMPLATRIAREIRDKIRLRTGGLTASAGVSFNKFLAKAASDYRKPNGMTVITPDKAGPFIDSLPVGKFFGVGRVTEKRMQQLGIMKGKDLKMMSRERLVSLFGKAGNYFYQIAHEKDERPVTPEWVRKSVGKETTLQEDIVDMEIMRGILAGIAERIEIILRKMKLQGKRVTLKVKFSDFQQVTRSTTLAEPLVGSIRIMHHVMRLLDSTEAGKKKVRLLGITISNFTDGDYGPGSPVQLSLPLEGGASQSG